jgi:hypothetical protein
MADSLGHSSAGAHHITMALEKELATYRAQVSALQEQQGKFVLIHGADVVDFYAAYEDAIKAGYQQFKLEPFLVKQVSAAEAVRHFTRQIVPQGFVEVS